VTTRGTGPPVTHTAPPDWRTMTRHDFDDTAPPPPLFDLEPAQVRPVDQCGTGDILKLIEEVNP
jgi:hypothetical protein